MKKCRFFKTEARVLGFFVTRDGVKMDPKKIKAIAEWPRPVDGKAMQRFMGAVNFNREFSPEFAKIAAPLRCSQIDERCHIEWTPEMEHAFEALKSLFSRQHDAASNRLGEDHVSHDRCLFTGIGAWIGQKKDDGVIVPCICVSKKLTPTQQRWSATKRELYALMWAMQKLRHYLLGTLVHRPCGSSTISASCQEQDESLARRLDGRCLQFDFTTEYLPGENNILADALSRQHETDDLTVVNVTCCCDQVVDND